MEFIKTSPKSAARYADEFLRSLRGGVGAVYAAFRVSRGSFYEVRSDGAQIGVVSVSGDTLNAMMLLPDRMNAASEAFAAAKRVFGLTCAAAYPDDYYILSAASPFRPRIEPMALTYAYRGGVEPLPENKEKPFTAAWMRRETELSGYRPYPFAFGELKCETDAVRVLRRGIGDPTELRRAVLERRLFALGEKAFGCITEIPYSPDAWDIRVWVDPESRGVGIGSAMYRVLAGLTADYGKTATACVDPPDEGTRRALVRAGFVNTVNTLKLTFD